MNKVLLQRTALVISLCLAVLTVKAQSDKYSWSGGGKAVADAPVEKATETATDKNVDRKNCFIVISKLDPAPNLRVYAKDGNDTVLVKEYPACLSRARGQKQRPGDMKTPESYPGKPFSISQIQDASTWRHDFRDGRGNQLAYGHWFLRLLTPGHRGIGIHGSTGNEWSIPGSGLPAPQGRTVGRDSEGCIRLSDSNIIHLKENYAYVGMPVIIKPEGMGLLDFEKRIEQKAIAKKKAEEEAARKAREEQIRIEEQRKADSIAKAKAAEAERLEAERLAQERFVLQTKNPQDAFLANGNFDKSKFIKIASDTKEIPVQSKKEPTFESLYPATSYRIEKVSKGNYKIVILDEKAFWEASKYLIIIVK